MISLSLLAYGRAAIAAPCAFASLAVEIFSIVFVILRVLRTDLRRRTSTRVFEIYRFIPANASDTSTSNPFNSAETARWPFLYSPAVRYFCPSSERTVIFDRFGSTIQYSAMPADA